MTPPRQPSSAHFRRLLVGLCLLVSLAALAPLTFVLTSATKKIGQEIEARLASEALLLAPLALDDFAQFRAEPSKREAAIQLAQGLARESGARVTFIAREGEVLYDSAAPATTMDNHRGRPEVAEALVAGLGLDRRASRTIGSEHFYVARCGGPGHGVVRLALAGEAFLRASSDLRLAALLAGAVIIGLSIALAVVLARRASDPIRRVTQAAAELRSRAQLESPPVTAGDEVDLVGRTLSEVGQKLSTKLEALAADEAQLRAMLAGMVEGVLAVDDRGRVTFSNRAALDLLAISGDPKGRSLVQIVRLPGLHELVEAATRSDSAAVGELVLARDKGERSLLVKAHRYKAASRVGVVIVFEDVTELRRLERVRRDFVANVSHELKTPLTSIRGFVETLLDGAIDDGEMNRRFLTKIDTNVERLGSLVSDLLSLARIETADQEMQLMRVDWRVVTQACLRRQEAHARSKEIEVEADLAQTGCAVMGEEEGLTQVVDNLLDNALKYTPRRGKIRVSLTRQDDEIVLAVSDTGIGIPAEDRERIFERFYRVDKARSRELGGTGLGLSIVKHLVTAMHGKVSVQSKVGKGSTFEVRLPVA